MDLKLPHHKDIHIPTPRSAVSVVEQLQEHGYDCYVVGGYLRDFYCNLKPKDVDLVTNATPEQIKAVFGRKCLLIGRRFRLAHVRSSGDIIEVSTYRAAHTEENQDKRTHSTDGMILRDNVYGTLEEDIARRDLTINALYYDPTHQILIDAVDGMKDLEQGIVRLIGDPLSRLQEDPVRIWRAIRLQQKLRFELETELEAAIKKTSDLLDQIPAGRRFDEYTKLFLHGHGEITFDALKHYQVLHHLFPALADPIQPANEQLIYFALANTDVRVRERKGVNPGFLIAVILWPLYQHHLAEIQKRPPMPMQLMSQKAASYALEQQVQFTSIPKRFSAAIRAIWTMQHWLEQRRPRQVIRLLNDPKFRAAYDFLELRASAYPKLKPLADWWHEIQFDKSKRTKMIKALGTFKRKKA